MSKKFKRIKPLSKEMKKLVWGAPKENAGAGWRRKYEPDSDERGSISGHIQPTRGLEK